MNITPIAIEELKKLLNNSETPVAGIRFFSEQGCCGPALHMSLVEKSSEGDKEILIDSVKFLIENSAEELLEGVTIDYSENGFKVEGMKNNSGCCG